MTVIAVNACSALAGGGISVARNLATSLAGARTDWRCLLLHSDEAARPSDPIPNLEPIHLPSLRSPLRRLIWEQAGLPRLLRARGAMAVIQLGGIRSFGASRGDVTQISVWQNAHLWGPPTPGHSRRLRAYIRVQRTLMKATVGAVDVNVFLSEDSRRAASEAIGLEGARCVVVPIGPAPELFAPPPPPGLEARSPVLLAVGDMYPHKRFELILDAMARLRDVRPEVRLKLAGSPVDPVYARELQASTERLGLSDRVELLGRVGPQELRALYDEAIAYVAASSLESFGLTVVEAMARGLPVVTSERSAAPEICGDAASYFGDDPASLSDELRRILQDPDLWKRRQRLGLERATRYEWPRIAESYARLIETASASKAGVASA